MKRIITAIIIGLVITAMVGFASSCADTTGTAATAKDVSAENSAAASGDLEGVTIRVLGTTEFNDMVMKNVVGEFEEETGAKVELELIGPSEQLQKARLELSKNSPQYDVVMISSYDSGIYYTNGWVEDLDAMEQSTGISFNRDTFIPNLLTTAPCQWEGVTYGLPTLVSTNGILCFRKDIMENQAEKDAFKQKYGYELTPPKNWDQYYDISEFFTRKAGDKVAGEVLQDDFYGNALHLDAGGAMFDAWISRYMTGELAEDADPLAVEYVLSKDNKPIFNNEAGIKAIEDMKKLYDSGYTYPGSLAMTWTMIVEPFRTNGAFMGYSWAEDFLQVMLPENNEYADVLEWAPMPYDSNPRIVQGGWVATINKNSANKEAAYRFIVWLTSQETEAKELQAGVGWRLPFRQENFENPDLIKGYEFYGVVGEMLDSYMVTSEQSSLPETDLVKQALNVELQRVITGEKTAEQALQDASDAITQGLTEAGVYDR